MRRDVADWQQQWRNQRLDNTQSIYGVVTEMEFLSWNRHRTGWPAVKTCNGL